MATFKTNKGNTIIVDDEDAHKLAGLNIFESICPKGKRKSSFIVHFGGGTHAVTRLIMGLSPGDRRWVVCVDGDNFNLRKSNLRPMAVAELRGSRFSSKFSHKRHTTTTSKYRGVHWDTKKRKWVAAICTMGAGRSHAIGYFSSEEDAAKDWDEANRLERGETTYQNFPKTMA